MEIWVKGAYHCNYLYYRDNYLDQDMIFANVWKGGSMIQVAKVPVTNKKALENYGALFCSGRQNTAKMNTEPFQAGDEICFIDITNKDVFMGNKYEV